MFSVDSSTLIAFFAADEGPDTIQLEKLLGEGLLMLTPVVVSELLSDPGLPEAHSELVLSLPRISLIDGFWERVGYLRKTLLRKNKKARLADAMIAQCCIDHRLTLITRDQDFRHFCDQPNFRVFQVK